MFNLDAQSYYVEPWLEFNTPIVRQLAFAIASPNILKHCPSELDIKYSFDFHTTQSWQLYFNYYKTRLHYLDQHPTELENFLSQLKSTRLGLRFEMLIWFWLRDQDYHPYTLLGHSIQKIEGPLTLGELDFLLINQNTQQIEHWEVALKYYLAEHDGKLNHWFGLNRTDTLQRKLHHFTYKQFQFEEALQHQIQNRFAVLKGQLYLPCHSSFPLPSWINDARRMGFWGHQIPPIANEFHRLQRHEWICPHAQPSSQTAHWWTDGLYFQHRAAYFYMYRKPPLLNYSPISIAQHNTSL